MLRNFLCKVQLTSTVPTRKNSSCHSFPNKRKKVLNCGKKSYNLTWSSEIYTIETVYLPQQAGQIPAFTLKEYKGRYKHLLLLPVEKTRKLNIK